MILARGREEDHAATVAADLAQTKNITIEHHRALEVPAH